MIDIQKCSDDIRNKNLIDPTCDPAKNKCETIDPECAKPEDIIKWTATKRAYIRTLNMKIDFDSYDEVITRQ